MMQAHGRRCLNCGFHFTSAVSVSSGCYKEMLSVVMRIGNKDRAFRTGTDFSVALAPRGSGRRRCLSLADYVRAGSHPGGDL